MSQRKCKKHKEPITRICLKDQCNCDGVLCEKCISDNHKQIENCRIDLEEEPLSYFSINTNKTKYLDYFNSALTQICQIWEKGNQIIQAQLFRLQQKFLLQLNLICKTFALDSAEDIQNRLKYKLGQDDERDLKMNIEIIKCLYKNRQNIQNLDEIKLNTEQVCKKVNESLKIAFLNLNNNFQKLDHLLNKTDIFKIQKTMTQTLQEEHPKQMQQKGTSKKHQNEYKPQQQLILHKNNINQIEKQTTISQKRMVKIKQVLNPQSIINPFFNNNSYCIQYLIIQCPQLATQNNLVLLLMGLQNLKALVLNCKNQVWKCSKSLVHYKNGQQEPLDRLEYFYDFKRDLQELDHDKFFIKDKVNKTQAKQQTHYKLRNQWSLQRNTLSTQQTFQLIKRLKLKNIWLPKLSRSQFQFGIQGYDLSNIEQITLGHYGKQYSSIPFSLQQKFKSFNNLKCFVLIKTSHFILSLSNLFKKLNKLQVLVFEEIKYQGDQKHCQIFFNNIPKFCPELKKISITHLSQVNIDFICELPNLQTLFLIKSKKLSFNSKKTIKILNLNLFEADWDYLHLLRSLNPNQVKYLNIGYSNITPANILNAIQHYKYLTSLCLDKIVLNSNFTRIIQNNQSSLTNLSIAGCQTQISIVILDALRKCAKLQLVDISKCDLESQFVRNYPAQLKYIIVSRLSMNQSLVMKMFTEDIKIIESP